MSDPYDFFTTPKPPPAEPAAEPPVPAAGQFAQPVSGYGMPGAVAVPQRFGGQQQWELPPGQHGPPPGWAPRAARPGTVTAAAVIVFVQSAFWVLAGLGIIALALWARSEMNSSPLAMPGLGEVTALVMVVGLCVLTIAAFAIFCGIKVLAGAQWAAITVAVVEGISVVGSLLVLVQGDIVSAVMGAALPVAVLVCLLVEPSRRWLGAR